MPVVFDVEQCELVTMRGFLLEDEVREPTRGFFPKIKINKTRLKTPFNGKAITSMCRANVPIRLKRDKGTRLFITHSFYVVEDMEVRAILGCDFMREYGAEIIRRGEDFFAVATGEPPRELLPLLNINEDSESDEDERERSDNANANSQNTANSGSESSSRDTRDQTSTT